VLRTNDTPSYPAKVLLLGEHIVLRGARALAIPYDRFGARWAEGAEPDVRLLDFVAYLRSQFSAAELDTAACERAVRAGLRLTSDIPVGYGLGSSGAVCAAVLDRYGTDAARTLPLPELKNFLARMENHFHGNSSGTDPLIIFRRRPLLLGGTGLEEITPPALPAPYRLFLLDTGQPRSTATYVDRFLTRYDAEGDFAHQTESAWLPASAAALEALLGGAGAALWMAMAVLSRVQAKLLPDFVPAPVRAVWAGADHVLKLCGAGGGGFMLGLSRNWPATQQELTAAGWTVHSVAWT
jgi:mevalonate kinase